MHTAIHNLHVTEDAIYKWRCVLVSAFANFANLFLVASKHSCKPMSINVLPYINLTINTGSGDENTSLHEYYSQSSLPALTIQVTIPSPLCAVQIHWTFLPKTAPMKGASSPLYKRQAQSMTYMWRVGRMAFFVSGRIVRCRHWWRRDCGCDDKSISHWSGKLGDSRDSLTEVVQIWRLRLRAWVSEATCATEPYQYLLWHVEPMGQHIPSFQG